MPAVSTIERRLLQAALSIATAIWALTLVLHPAHAQDEGGNKIAIHIEGAKAATYADRIRDAVPEGLDVIDDGDFTRSLAQSGLPGGKMGYAITSPTQRRLVLKLTRRAIEKSGVAAAVIGRVRASKKGGLEVVLVVADKSDELLLDETVSLKGSSDEQIANIAEVLVPALAPLAPEPEPKEEEEPEEEAQEDEPEEDEEEEEDDDDDDADFEPNRPGSELFSLGVGVEFGGRFFDYNDAVFDNLRPYDVFGVPGLHVMGEVYPLAPWDIVVASDIGLTVSFMQAFGLSSQTDDESLQFSNNYNRFTAGLRYRFRIGDKDDHPFVIGLGGKFGFLNFSFDPENEASTENADEVGEVSYLFIRPGLDARLPIADWFALMPAFGYVAPLSKGDAYDRINGASVHGLDMELMLAFVVGLGFEVRTGVEYMRYFASFDPQVGDTFVAGGALDQYLMLRAGAAYVF